MELSDAPKFSPYISAEKEKEEFTPQAVVLGVIISAGMCAAMLYIGLRLGMTICASIPAAVISMGILRGILRKGTILENNIVQTIGSAGESLAAGALFTMPALLMAGVWSDFDYWTVTNVTLLGGILGVMFMIPLRRSLILETKEVTYPEGVACAEVLKAGEKKGTGALLLLIGGILGAGAKFALAFIPKALETLTLPIVFSKRIFTSFAIEFSLAGLGVGYIVGPNIAVLVLLGGAIAWYVAIPLYLSFNPELTAQLSKVTSDKLNEEMLGILGKVFGKVRYLGVGAMVVGGLWSVFRMRTGIAKALKSLAGRITPSSVEPLKTIKRTDQDLPMKFIILGAVICILGIYILYGNTLHSYSTAVIPTLAMFIAGFFFVAVSSYITGLVGSSNNPVSGMTICTILFTFALLWLFGISGKTGITALLIVAGVVCSAAATAGDISQDLKTGYLVGASPKRQQVGQIIGVVAGAFIIAPVLSSLHQAYKIGEGGSLSAPQASMFRSLAEGLMMPKEGGSGIPWNIVLIGAIMAIGIGIADEFLRKANSKFRLHIMPLAVGLYLPLRLGVIIFIGGLLSILHTLLMKKKDEKEKEWLKQLGVLLASGMVAGEALAGIAVAGIYIALKMSPPEGGIHWYPGVVFIAAAAVLLLSTKTFITKKDSERE
ncbi:MAG: oligopeptide transporter, OPT family [Planctomycetota bacterium]|nr:oligopeptide transporter, OPT family [Planctomycetota bacterium]